MEAENSIRNIFIVNPKAGQGKGNAKFAERIRAEAERAGATAEIYTTAGVGDAEILARQISEEVIDNIKEDIENTGNTQNTQNTKEEIRIFACGGDGTLNEVLNGIIGNENISVGVVPIGTGNDFCRNFPEAGDFSDIASQLSSHPVKCDAIRYSGLLAGKEQTRYCANMFNIGFDCNVVDLTATLKKYPFLAGSMAYLMAVFAILVRKKGANLKIEIDGETKYDGPLLLTAVANGSFCGGGVKSSPNASLSDGKLDINIIYNVKRREFIKKFPYYSKGTHMELPDIDKILYAAQAKKVVITPNEGTMRLCTDGEIVDAGRVEMEVMHDAFSFLLPQDATKPEEAEQHL